MTPVVISKIPHITILSAQDMFEGCMMNNISTLHLQCMSTAGSYVKFASRCITTAGDPDNECQTAVVPKQYHAWEHGYEHEVHDTRMHSGVRMHTSLHRRNRSRHMTVLSI